MCVDLCFLFFFFFKQKTAYEMRISDWSSGVCSSDLNIWAFNIIFCGHFPAGVATFTQEETENETKGLWYYRQLLGSANISGGKLLHLMSGNLSNQIEHNLFPDLPARRYPQIAEEVREICERYGQIGRAHAELQSLMRISYAVFCLKTKTK